MTLYEQIGGDEAVRLALDRFYEKVMSDPRVSVFFEGTDVGRVKAKQRTFVAMALGGPSDYDGRDLRAAHAAPRARGLDGERFDIFVEHFRDTMAELGVPQEQIGQVMDIVYGGKDQVLAR